MSEREDGAGPPQNVDDWEDAFEGVEGRFVGERDVRTLVEAEQGVPPQITKFTPRRVATIFSELQKGRPRGTAALAAGVTTKTFYNWYNQGESIYHDLTQGGEPGEEESRYLYFYYGCLQAENVWERNTLDAIEEMAREQNRWNALMRLLESRMPEKYSKKAQQQEVKGGAGGEGTTMVQINLGDAGPGGEGRTVEAEARFPEVADDHD